MSTILVVDDSVVDQQLAGKLLERETDFKVVYAANGREALQLMAQAVPDMVVTDMQMPEVNGLELVDRIRSTFPAVPVILMTAHGSEELACEALDRGASSYVPKRHLARDLIRTVQELLELASGAKRRRQLLDCWDRTEMQFVIDNQPQLIPVLVAHLQEHLAGTNLCDEAGLIRVGVALSAALDNALYHGNLEIGTDQFQHDGPKRAEIAARRQHESPYCSRRIHVTVRLTPMEAVFVIRDEGPGIDLATVSDPSDPANLEKGSGRGLRLIRSFMDDISFNDATNEITMIKRHRLGFDVAQPS
jgi:CheY-like chemotaxis protein